MSQFLYGQKICVHKKILYFQCNNRYNQMLLTQITHFINNINLDNMFDN